MIFPEFETSGRRLLFFSRGRGRGHAIPDIEILRALHALDPGIETRIASYSTGAATFTAFGYPVIDLGLPDDSPVAEMSALAGRLIRWLKPDLVAAHEEFAAMPAARIFDTPTVFVTDYFTDPESYSMHALKFADQILFLGEEGAFDPPAWVRSKVHYVGRVFRNFQYDLRDRLKAREELGIASDAFTVLVLPGNWTERHAPLAELARAALDLLTARRRKVIWVAGSDQESIGRALAGHDALVLETYWEPDRLMAAADVALTKANRKTVFELHHMGLPAIALSWGLNPIDDRAIRDLEAVQLLNARGLAAHALASAMETAAGRLRVLPPRPDPRAAGTCARLIAAALRRDSG
jgi:UDP-N-acetylglucosamine:LPS N-acetylglucosamine transferase